MVLFKIEDLDVNSIEAFKPTKDKSLKSYVAKFLNNGEPIKLYINDMELRDDIIYKKNTLKLKLKSSSFIKFKIIRELEDLVLSSLIKKSAEWHDLESEDIIEYINHVYDNFKSVLQLQDSSFELDLNLEIQNKKILTKIFNEDKTPLKYKKLKKGDMVCIIAKLNGIKMGKLSSSLSLSLIQIKKYNKKTCKNALELSALESINIESEKKKTKFVLETTGPKSYNKSTMTKDNYKLESTGTKLHNIIKNTRSIENVLDEDYDNEEYNDDDLERELAQKADLTDNVKKEFCKLNEYDINNDDDSDEDFEESDDMTGYMTMLG